MVDICAVWNNQIDTCLIPHIGVSLLTQNASIGNGIEGKAVFVCVGKTIAQVHIWAGVLVCISIQTLRTGIVPRVSLAKVPWLSALVVIIIIHHHLLIVFTGPAANAVENASLEVGVVVHFDEKQSAVVFPIIIQQNQIVWIEAKNALLLDLGAKGNGLRIESFRIDGAVAISFAGDGSINKKRSLLRVFALESREQHVELILEVVVLDFLEVLIFLAVVDIPLLHIDFASVKVLTFDAEKFVG